MYAQRVHDIGAMYGHGIGAQVEAACDLFVRLAIDNRLTGFRAAFVFDVEQTEGKPLTEFSKTTGNPREFADKLKEFVAKQGISVEYDKSISPAQGVSFGGKIRLIPVLLEARTPSCAYSRTCVLPSNAFLNWMPGTRRFNIS